MWDRGSLVAIDPSLRAKYASVLLSALAPGGQILLVAFERIAGACALQQAVSSNAHGARRALGL